MPREDLANKENYSVNSITKSGSGVVKRRTFGTLLQEAHEEIIHEIDEKAAVQSQCKDIYDMVNKLCVDFEREDEGLAFVPILLSQPNPPDSKLAYRLHENEKNLEKQRRQKKISEENKNESVALRFAIEERRRVASLAQKKRDQAENDEKYAKKSVLEDLEADWKYQDLCKDDEKLALEVPSTACCAHPHSLPAPAPTPTPTPTPTPCSISFSFL
jgi:hypothetical protein